MLAPLALSCFMALAGLSQAAEQAPVRFKDLDEAGIAQALRGIHKSHPLLPDRIAAVSAAFLGTPYRLGPMGEGADGEFDRGPLYSFRELDCTTFVEEVMALSLEADLEKAKALLQRIRYKGGQVSYVERNHFPEADWLPNNQAAGLLKDISLEVAGTRAEVSHKRISKRAWHAGHTLKDVKGFPDASAAEQEARLKRMQELGRQFEDAVSTVPYVPLALVPELLDRIPSGTIANLVRANLPDKPVVITHQMLIVVKGGQRFVRHAASGKAVEDQPAQEFFQRYAKASWPVVGLNLDQIRDRR